MDIEKQKLTHHSYYYFFLDDKSYWGDPLPTYQMQKNHYAEPEDSVRLYCEAFVGKYRMFILYYMWL